MKLRAKKYAGDVVEFTVENKGETKLPDGRKYFVSMFTINGQNHFSSSPHDGEHRESFDAGFLGALGIDAETIDVAS